MDNSQEVRYDVEKLVIYFQSQPDLGEDAEPICILLSATSGLIGVFDGLGGAGGEKVKLADGAEHTGAWLASRMLRDIVMHTYRYLMDGTRDEGGYDGAAQRQDPRSNADFTIELRRAIREKLGEQAARMHTGNGRLKSRLIKTLPTTMAISRFDLAKHEFSVIWAGDSRVYSLRPDIGLLQATTDDLKSNADALQNLTDDSPLSNYVSADTEFVLHERRFPLQPHTILLAASDGCFGYVRTPFHFEHLLLSTMHDATSWGDWQKQLGMRIAEMTGDDATLSAAAFGWADFASCKSQFANRYQACAQLVRTYDSKHENAERLRGELNEARQVLTQTRLSMWEDYRETYESLTRVPTRDIQSPDREKQRDGTAECGELR